VTKRSTLSIERRTQKIRFGMFVIVIVVTEMQGQPCRERLRLLLQC